MRMKGFAMAMDLQILHYETKMLMQEQRSFRERCTAKLNLLHEELQQSQSPSKKSSNVIEKVSCI